MSFLVFNAGSSGLKAAVFDGKDLSSLAIAAVGWGAEPEDAFDQIAQALAKNQSNLSSSITAVGHRIVHGGVSFRDSVVLTNSVKDQIRGAAGLAPLHNRPALEIIARAEAAYPGVPHVGVFDTAYFHDLPPRQFVYPVPYDWYEKWGVRRFGFHGISHRSCAERAAEILGRNDLRVVSCHLGQGCSATASRGGRAVATTMGFTPLEGLMMGSRSGSVDPGILLYLQEKHQMDALSLETALNHESGLKGVSGLSSDFREVEAAAKSGNERCRLALDMFTDRVRSAIGALSVTLGGIDVLVFTGGVGEHSPSIRAAVCQGLECLGLEIDIDGNNRAQSEFDIGHAASRGRIFVLPAREERAIAEEVRRLLPAGTLMPLK